MIIKHDTFFEKFTRCAKACGLLSCAFRMLIDWLQNSAKRTRSLGRASVTQFALPRLRALEGTVLRSGKQRSCGTHTLLLIPASRNPIPSFWRPTGFFSCWFSAESWYNPLFYSLRRGRLTLVLTGTNIPVYNNASDPARITLACILYLQCTHMNFTHHVIVQ